MKKSYKQEKVEMLAYTWLGILGGDKSGFRNPFMSYAKLLVSTQVTDHFSSVDFQ